MKITKLTTENVKRVKAVTIEPDGTAANVSVTSADGALTEEGLVATTSASIIMYVRRRYPASGWRRQKS